MKSTITMNEILLLFKKNLGLKISSQSLYYYIRAKNFPPSTGFGRPRLWHRLPVEKWIKQQAKKFNSKS